jgi:hypothetical protein
MAPRHRSSRWSKEKPYPARRAGARVAPGERGAERRVVPGECGARGMWCPGNVVPGECGARGMWCPGNVVPGECGARGCGARGMWCPGLWCPGNVVPGECGNVCWAPAPRRGAMCVSFLNPGHRSSRCSSLTRGYRTDGPPGQWIKKKPRSRLCGTGV